ncbi:hypothetical protein [Phytopseudomonas daroniae]|uniref:hypothetical protein n=1 Tax=Phytopseudomonas daroniae TaxID=2487519 RepID=UPI001038555A|nr:hypothetical protein [Pseudomonas daroniae]TBU75206.1 hypothetical protein DNK10_11155 [Pseudomonas daroniae]
MAKILPKVRFCWVTVETKKTTERHLVPARDNATALALFSHITGAEISVDGNIQLEPENVFDDGRAFDFFYEGKRFYFAPGTPGYEFLEMSYAGLQRAYDDHRQADFDR